MQTGTIEIDEDKGGAHSGLWKKGVVLKGEPQLKGDNSLSENPKNGSGTVRLRIFGKRGGGGSAKGSV